MNRSFEERRPTTAGLVELHVLYVPDEQWNGKLNKASADGIDSFLSAGFIRVFPDLSLRALRDELTGLLGSEKAIDNFVFLKCVGRSLAVVKSKQEKELKVKSFAPPYAPQPELYLLPGVENDRSIYSAPRMPDRQNYHTEPQGYHSPQKTSIVPAVKNQATNPRITQRAPHNPSPAQSPDEDVDEDDEVESFSSGEDKEDNVSRDQGCNWEDTVSPPRRIQEQPQPIGKKAERLPNTKSQVKSRTAVKKGSRVLRNSTRDSGVPESLGDRDSVFSHSQSRKTENTLPSKDHREQINQVCDNPLPLPTPALYTLPPVAPLLARATHNPAPPAFITDRDELVEGIKLAKQERKQLEKTRQDLLRRAKDLLGQNRQRRNQARDAWKKRYFDTKKATVPLEETLKKVRQELETYYHKVLHQLQARDARSKPKHHGKTKNDLIIKVTTENHEIDQLKRKVDDAKMKLVTELKLRKQAASELRALRAELSQKKTQTSLSGPQRGSTTQTLGHRSRSQAQRIPG
ncbi:spermatogenesis-associated protein 1 [Amia ocellicauda]|uniref:spermatogenesis-associated protein 1 n=1 Tax=Amia ocellicauda TaxID=2972642 RepID=UPI003463D240